MRLDLSAALEQLRLSELKGPWRLSSLPPPVSDEETESQKAEVMYTRLTASMDRNQTSRRRPSFLQAGPHQASAGAESPPDQTSKVRGDTPPHFGLWHCRPATAASRQPGPASAEDVGGPGWESPGSVRSRRGARVHLAQQLLPPPDKPGDLSQPLSPHMAQPRPRQAGHLRFSLRRLNSVVLTPYLAQLSMQLLLAPLSCFCFNTNKQP